MHAYRGGVVVMVAQVRADRDDGFVSAPQSFQCRGDLLGCRASYGNRKGREGPEHFLQERELNLEGMLPVMGIVEDVGEGKGEQ